MATSFEEPHSGTDSYPLLVERPGRHEGHEPAISIAMDGDPSSSQSSDDNTPCDLDVHYNANRPATSSIPVQSSLSNPLDSINSSFVRREGIGSHRWSLFNSGIWIIIQIVFTMTQIIASIIVLSLSRNEHPKAPLFAWIVGYAAGCVTTLPVLYWRYLHCNQNVHQGATQVFPASSGNSDSNSYITISLTQPSEEVGHQNSTTASWNDETIPYSNYRLSVLVDNLKVAMDCFFAMWFVVGNVWIFGGHFSYSDAPNMYRLCIVFLTFSCIAYAMPFILCAMICCCFPCIISFLGIHETFSQVRGATADSINALPILKFTVNKIGNANRETISGVTEGGVVAAGTERERAFSAEDSVCCICLTRYEDNDELRELPCSHFFHTACVDKWLKINASCPLCKYEVGQKNAYKSIHAMKDIIINRKLLLSSDFNFPPLLLSGVAFVSELEPEVEGDIVDADDEDDDPVEVAAEVDGESVDEVVLESGAACANILASGEPGGRFSMAANNIKPQTL
ncbi:Zinc finger, RING-type [Dillenia turbinata]|uniref:Zinc finger, RING-type n=1 Tax=Dillenia turbinata TaxID=194707 RepID=A0AAN8ZP62_9MAGN